jgi:2-succinyl-6-hydroxy-2,4-cyclohexadiene-1-carboxylate synthase
MRSQKIDLASLAASVLGFGAGVMPTVWGELGEVTLPVLIIVGEKDNKYREIGSHLHAKLQHSSLVVVPNVGHAPQLEDPENVANVIDDWVSTLHR